MSTAFAAEPGDTLWTRLYGGTGYDWEFAYSVQQTTDGGYVAAGKSNAFGAGDYDFWVVKTDASGDILWTRNYGGSGADEGYFVQPTSDGGYLVAGKTDSFGGGGFDVYLVKTDANGDTLWTRTYGGSYYDAAYCVELTSDGGYIVGGWTESFGAGSWDFWLLKTDAAGDTLWTRYYGGSEYDCCYSLQQTTDGGYIATGMTQSFGAGDYDVWVMKTDDNGDTLWTRTYGGSERERGYSVRQTSDGGYIVTGYTETFGPGTSGVYLLKMDADGDTLWTRTYGGDGWDWSHCVQQTTDGGYIIAGITMSYGGGGNDVYLVKTDAKGDTLWTRAYGGSGGDVGNSVRQTADGGYIAAGYTESFGGDGWDVWLLRIAGEAPGPDVSIEIVPDDPPVTVPQGGSFGYTGTITNNTEDPQTTDIWVMAVGPEKEVYGPFKEFSDVELDPYETRSRHFNQRVPNLAPLGFYNYIAYCGDYPSTVIDSSFFQIEVVEGVGSSQGCWVLAGSFLEGDVADLPSEFALWSNYPNPFNASTVISYQVPAAGHVKLEIYNLFGQKVATVVDGQQEAGYKSVSWENSEAASGVYFYKLTAGGFTEVKRMTLLR